MVGGTDGLVDTRFGVCRDSRLEKVGLALERDHLHKVKGVRRVPNLLVAQSNKKTVGNKLNVLAHELGVHTDKRDGESVLNEKSAVINKQLLGKLTSQELLLNDDSLLDDLCNSVGVRASSEMGEEETGKVGVETLVSRDELVREGETRHETSLLKPEDGRERTREEDTLHGSKSNESLAETRFLVRDPSKSPVGLLSDTRNGVHSVKEEVSSSSVLNVGVDEERVGLGVDVLPIVPLVRLSVARKRS